MIDRTTLRIMVLDDDAFMLKLLLRMLLTNGFAHTTTCDSGRAALERVVQPTTCPHVIICDLNMPEMDGVEFVRALVARGYSGGLILISGEDERVLASAARLARGHSIRLLGHLGKPVSSAALVALLEAPATHFQSSVRPTPSRQCEELRIAIARSQLINHYQPKVDVKTGRVVGVEALVRWLHPQDGIVFPDEFIAVAEENGLIEDLTRSVVDAALAQSAKWRSEGTKLEMSINVSMATLASLDFPDVLTRQAANAGVSPAKIVVEVTESRLAADAHAMLEVLTRLRIKGFRLSIDDFGTGHSCLTNLRDLPFDELKVDRGFVHHAGADNTVRAMYDASVGLARRLGIGVVAEGVEDRSDWEFLRRTGCDFAQGYFIGRPMPASELPTWQQGWHARLRAGLAPAA